MNNTSLAILRVLQKCMNVQPAENLLIVTDDKRIDLAHQFAMVGRELGFSTTLVEGTAQQGGEPPQMVCGALEKADVALLITSGSFSNTRARADASARGVRVASMPTITEEIVNQTLSGDLDDLADITQKLAGLLGAASKVRITTPRGMDFSFEVSGRKAFADTGDLTARGAFGNLPPGEACISPIETSGNGRIIVDGVIFGIGTFADDPLEIEMAGGAITHVGGPMADRFTEFVNRFDQNATRLAEFGIGTNRGCQIMNNILVDEKVFGTIHLACGNNLFIGGQQSSNIHYDMIICQPTVYFDDVCIIRDGEHLY